MAIFHYNLLKKKQTQIRNASRILGFVFLIFIVFSFIAFLPFSASVQIWISIVAVLAVSHLCLKLEGNNLNSIGLRLNIGFLSEFAIGILLGLLLILFQALIIFFFDGFTWVRNTQINLGHIIYALISFLAISLYEELLFRGYAFQWAVRGLGNTTALLLFGLFFVIAHLDNPGMTGGTLLLGSLNIGLASVLLGLAWIRTKSLALPVGIHLGWNWTQGSLLGFGVSGEKSQGYWAPVFNDLPHWFTGGDFGLEASLPCTAVCLIMCICFVLWKSKNMRIIAVPHQNRVPRL